MLVQHHELGLGSLKNTKIWCIFEMRNGNNKHSKNWNIIQVRNGNNLGKITCGCCSAKPMQKSWARQNPPFPESQASPAVPREEFLGNISGISVEYYQPFLWRLNRGKKTSDYLNSQWKGNLKMLIVLSKEIWKCRFILKHWGVERLIFHTHPTPNSSCKPHQPFLQTLSLESSSQPARESPWAQHWVALPEAFFLGIRKQIPGVKDCTM